MALDLAKLSRKTLPVTVEFAGETVQVEYRPAVITTTWTMKMRDAEATMDMEAMASGALELLSSWDLEDGGKPLALSKKNIEQLPLTLVGRMLAAATKDATGGDEAKKD